MKTIYFDYNATTPLDPKVREAMLPFLGEIFGNPSSIHKSDAKRGRSWTMPATASPRVASKPSEVIFTSGGTESDNLAIFGAARLLTPQGTSPHHLAASSTMRCSTALITWQKRRVRRDLFAGRHRRAWLLRSDLAKAIRPETILVSIMAANNEIGTLQPVAELGALCRERGVFFHTDAVQWFGKEPFDSIHQFNADLVSVCAHKFHGPKGAGALFVRSPLHPDPIIFGGCHENERRAGTENLPAIAGLTVAVEQMLKNPVFPRALLLELTERLLRLIDSLPGVVFRGSRQHRLC